MSSAARKLDPELDPVLRAAERAWVGTPLSDEERTAVCPAIFSQAHQHQRTLEPGSPMLAKALPLSLVLLAAGCADAPPNTAENAASPPYHRTTTPAFGSAPSEASGLDAFEMRAGGRQLVLLRPRESSLSGDRVRLMRVQWSDETSAGFALMGSVYGAPVYVRVDGTRASGTIGDQEMELRVERKGMAIEVSGTVGGSPVRFHLDDEGLEGVIGGWLYGLRRAERGFAGRRRTATTVAHDFTLRLPDLMAPWDDADIAAVLVIFLRDL
jgi:hypothetical protein